MFDVNPMSWLSSRFLGSASVPIELQSVGLHNLKVFLEQDSYSNWNVKTIADHVSQKLANPQPLAEHLEEDVGEGLHTMTGKYRADKIVLSNISISVCVHPMCDAGLPVMYNVDKIFISDVGKKGNGVFLYQLVEILIETLLMAVVKSAPANLQLNLVNAVGAGLEIAADKLDYGMVHFDSGNGNGIQEVGTIAGWVAGEAAALPTKVAASNAKLGLEALKVNTALTNKAIATQTAITNSEIGTQVKLNSMGVRMNVESNKIGAGFTNAGVRMNSDIIADEAKANLAANNFLTKLRTGFATGFGHGLR